MTFVLLLTLVTGCASKSAGGYLESPAESAPAAKDDYYVESELMDFGYENGMSADGKGDTQLEETESTVQSANAAKINRKIIWTVDLSVETLEFDQFLTQLDRAIADFGGYLESSSVSGTSINYSHNRCINRCICHIASDSGCTSFCYQYIFVIKRIFRR